MNVRIYRPAKTAMQSGRAREEWVLEHEREVPRVPEPLMGWTAADDTLNEVKLKFATAEDAVAFAQKKGWSYTVGQTHERKVRPRNYVDSFRYIPPENGD